MRGKGNSAKDSYIHSYSEVERPEGVERRGDA